MATALALATSRLASDSLNNPSENTPSAVHRLQMAIADTECAQALLELAMSIAPSPPSGQDGAGQDQIESKSSSTFITGHSPKSLLKRELETPLETNSTNQSASDEEHQRMELVKRIRLDHNYYWTDDRIAYEVKLEPDQFRTYCETIKQNGSVPVSESSLDEEYDSHSSLPRRADKYNGSVDESKMTIGSGVSAPVGVNYHSKSDTRSFRQRTMSESCSPSPVSKSSRPRSVSESKTGSNWKFKEEKKMSILKYNTLKKNDSSEEDGPLHIKQESTDDDGSRGDSGMEGDEKFHNFHLLMKCLVANEPDQMTGGESSRSSYRTQSMSSDDTDEGQRSSPDNLNHSGSSHDYKCHVCQKTFQKKRYLTKHAFRMHPLLSGEEGTPIKITFEGFMCPHCKTNIKPKKDLQRHIANCPKNNKRWKSQNELDLVNCQFCGVRMRRQLLVRHLADEHCVDRIGEYPDEGSHYSATLEDRCDNNDPNCLLEESKARLDFPKASSSPHQGGHSGKAHQLSESSELSWKDVVEFGAIKKEPLERKPVEFKATREPYM